MITRPRLLLALLCLSPVLIGVTLRYGESTWLVPAGLLPLLLLGPTRILPSSLVTVVAFWIALAVLSAVANKVEWQSKWRTVRGLTLLSFLGLGLVVVSLMSMSLQWDIALPSWSGAAAIGWELFLLSLTRNLAKGPGGPVLMLRLWLLVALLPCFVTLAIGTLAGLCC
jgi:hypothetical protein